MEGLGGNFAAALVASLASVVVAIGAFLPWLKVAFGGVERPLRGWDLGQDARACLALALAGAVAGFVVGRRQGSALVLTCKLVLILTGVAIAGLALLQGPAMQVAVGLPGLSVRTGVGLVTVLAGALGHIGVGAVAPWRAAAE